LPSIQGIEFDEEAYQFISKLIERLKSDGVAEVYPLPAMHGGKGELRIAHYAPSNKPSKAPKAKGVFARIAPRPTGAILIRRTRSVGEPAHVKLNARNFDNILKVVTVRRDLVKDRLEGILKVVPDKPETVSCGRVESKQTADEKSDL
jgi:hypothetical protein